MERVMISYVWVDVVVTVIPCVRALYVCKERRDYLLVCPSGHISSSVTMIMTSTPTHLPQDGFVGRLSGAAAEELEPPFGNEAG